MKYFLIIIPFVATNQTEAQKQDSCSCIYTYTMSYPKKAEENKISGTVIVEFDRDSNCVFSNPKIIKGLGHGCDEEALKAANQIIVNTQKCFAKCSKQKCEIGKLKQPFTFRHTEEK